MSIEMVVMSTENFTTLPWLQKFFDRSIGSQMSEGPTTETKKNKNLCFYPTKRQQRVGCFIECVKKATFPCKY